jgi:hypothetical protein
MSSQQATVDEVMELVETLSPVERVRLVERVMTTLEHELTRENYAEKRSLLGLWQGTAITEQDIDEARKDMWSTFPHEDL